MSVAADGGSGAKVLQGHGREARGDRVELAHEPPIEVGPLRIEPPHRRIVHGDGREEIVEPRIMQVLVALLRADGAILSRDDLISCCWKGRIVGDDSINRALSRLRRIAQEIGDGVFRIETLNKVGYRLIREPAAANLETAAADEATHRASWHGWSGRPRGKALVAVAIVLLVGAALAAAAWIAGPWQGRAGEVPSIAVVTETQDAEASALARDLAADLSLLAGARAADLTIIDSARSPSADYIVRIGGERRADRLEARLTLVESAGGELLWSKRFQQTEGSRADLRQQIAVKLGNVLLCTLHGAVADGERIDTVTLRLFLTACDRRADSVDGQQINLMRQVTARAPGFARGWALLAVFEAQLGSTMGGVSIGGLSSDNPQKRAFRDSARRHLARARTLDPSLGDTYLAEAWLVNEPSAWAERLAIYERGVAAAPDHAWLYSFRGDELMRIGRMTDSVENARHAVALEPHDPEARNTLVTALAYAGRIQVARRELEAAERIWPDSRTIREVRFRFDLRYGDPRNALRMLDNPRDEGSSRDRSSEMARPFLRARIDPSSANVEAAIRAYSDRPLRDRVDGYTHLQTLGHFGRVEEAYRLLAGRGMSYLARDGSELLFRPQMRPIRLDRRFMILMHRAGLLRYWQSSGAWPDFCADRDLPYDCRAEARRLTASSTAASR